MLDGEAMRPAKWLQRLGFFAAGISVLSLLLAVASPRFPTDVDDDQPVLCENETVRHPDLAGVSLAMPQTAVLAFSLPDPVDFDVPPQIDAPLRAPQLSRFSARAPPFLV